MVSGLPPDAAESLVTLYSPRYGRLPGFLHGGPRRPTFLTRGTKLIHILTLALTLILRYNTNQSLTWTPALTDHVKGHAPSGRDRRA